MRFVFLSILILTAEIRNFPHYRSALVRKKTFLYRCTAANCATLVAATMTVRLHGSGDESRVDQNRKRSSMALT